MAKGRIWLRLAEREKPESPKGTRRTHDNGTAYHSTRLSVKKEFRTTAVQITREPPGSLLWMGDPAFFLVFLYCSEPPPQAWWRRTASLDG